MTPTPMNRLMAALSHRETDRVPFFLFATLHGARLMGLTPREYFLDARRVVEGQLRMRARWDHDCLTGFLGAALEHEAWGGRILWRDDGPPNAGEPVVRRVEEIPALEPPRVHDCPGLLRSLEAVRGLRAAAGADVPIVGVAMAPLSLAVMLLGFERWLDVLMEHPDLRDRMLRVGEEFCVEWSNAQLEAGATAVALFDPVCSPLLITPAMYRDRGLPCQKRTIARLRGPAALHLGSAPVTGMADELAQTGAVIVAASAMEDIAKAKAAAAGRFTILGNLNAILLRNWDAQCVDREVRRLVAAAARGGGFILADNHGEIPWQVSERTLDELAEAVHVRGRYPVGAEA